MKCPRASVWILNPGSTAPLVKKHQLSCQFGGHGGDPRLVSGLHDQDQITVATQYGIELPRNVPLERNPMGRGNISGCGISGMACDGRQPGRGNSDRGLIAAECGREKPFADCGSANIANTYSGLLGWLDESSALLARPAPALPPHLFDADLIRRGEQDSKQQPRYEC